ncbi:2-(hydroxymethyl)glutarate dehydrogenase [Methylobacterium crusticola]|uniref:2-(Hydroxymethyl)glutarate dehydrogenase n=1 Tax=Methylobacterium crusticola TaxID=1697972 RepID=A0ABQ4R5S6_9HYPH|nr:NAD(P)-dependent oxidoreductase [Methylobacterium crusticola]GJD52161.1 2-(hydroxymethyl)glutarate dehydrogenase [Methylobacterium crusticola]
MDVGMIGLGLMGRAMATNIARAGHTVRAWNRSPAEPPEGVAMVDQPREAMQSDVVLTMLSDDAAIRDVVLAPGVLDQARAGLVHVVTSTISVAFADELHARHGELGIGYVSAPVFGRPDVAAAAQLGIMVAGAPDAVAKARAVLDGIGRKTWVLGEDPKTANAAKIAGNMMIATAIESMAEAAVLAESCGLDPAVFFDLVLQTQFGGSRAYENYSAKILKGEFEAGFRLRLGLKDLGLAAAAAEGAGRKLPLLAALVSHMRAAAEAGLGEKDWSAVAEFTRDAST